MIHLVQNLVQKGGCVIIINLFLKLSPNIKKKILTIIMENWDLPPANLARWTTTNLSYLLKPKKLVLLTIEMSHDHTG